MNETPGTKSTMLIFMNETPGTKSTLLILMNETPGTESTLLILMNDAPGTESTMSVLDFLTFLVEIQRNFSIFRLFGTRFGNIFNFRFSRSPL
ncbi:MAG: hypothetical protein LBL39_01515 [Planctomycetaceae bacterium]|nr:hypothetical protein [Planctomycetaceae bacterium]